MTGESSLAEDFGIYGADPLMCLGDELRDRSLGEAPAGYLDGFQALFEC